MTQKHQPIDVMKLRQKEAGILKEKELLPDSFFKEYQSVVDGVATTIGIRGKLPPGIVVEDLKSWGVEGLIKAKKYYDETKGTQFKTYAYYRIRGEILDHLRREWAYRNPVGYKQNQEKIKKRIADATGETMALLENTDTKGNSEPKMEEIISNSGVIYLISLENVEQMATMADVEDPTVNILEGIDNSQDHLLLLEEVRNLSELEIKLIELFYFKEMKQKEIAKELKISRSKVCRLHTKILERLRTRLDSRVHRK